MQFFHVREIEIYLQACNPFVGTRGREPSDLKCQRSTPSFQQVLSQPMPLKCSLLSGAKYILIFIIRYIHKVYQVPGNFINFQSCYFPVGFRTVQLKIRDIDTEIKIRLMTRTRLFVLSVECTTQIPVHLI